MGCSLTCPAAIFVTWLSYILLPGVVSVLEQNVALIDLYFGELSYQQILEEVTYDIFDAIGETTKD